MNISCSEKKRRTWPKDLGNLIATIEADTLGSKGTPVRCRRMGFGRKNEEMKALDIINDEWVSVEWQGDIGYVSAEYIKIKFVIDSGETMEEIKKRRKRTGREAQGR